MLNNKLDILVLLRETSDHRPPVRVTTRGAAISDRGLRRVPNPADLAALEEALHLKDNLGARVTVLAIGPDRLDDTLRLAFSMGADRGIRFWDHGVEGGDAVADARILARITKILVPDLVFSGNRMADRGDEPVPALAAAAADMPCIAASVSLVLNPDKQDKCVSEVIFCQKSAENNFLLTKNNRVEVLRKSDRGARQTVSSTLPCTILFEEVRTPRYPSIEAITQSLNIAIETWDLAHLGLPFWEIGASGAYLAAAEYGAPRPDPVRVVTPDPKLPAFERILSLLSGGIKAREGKLHTLSIDDTAAGLLRIFREEGLTP